MTFPTKPKFISIQVYPALRVVAAYYHDVTEGVAAPVAREGTDEEVLEFVDEHLDFAFAGIEDERPDLLDGLGMDMGRSATIVEGI